MSVWLGTGKRSARRVLRGRRDEIGVAPAERRGGPEEEESRPRGRGETAHHLVAQISNPHSASKRVIFALHISEPNCFLLY